MTRFNAALLSATALPPHADMNIARPDNSKNIFGIIIAPFFRKSLSLYFYGFILELCVITGNEKKLKNAGKII